MRGTVVVLTHGAPYDPVENSFFLPELSLLANAFGRVILVPSRRLNVVAPSLPEKVSVDYSYADRRRRRFGSLRAFMSFSWLSNLSGISSWREFRCLLKYENRVGNCLRALNALVAARHLNLEDVVFYSFWKTEEASALALLGLRHPCLKFVSRAHGYDLYAERGFYQPPAHVKRTICRSSGIFCCSRHGADYLRTCDFGDVDNVRVGYLGIRVIDVGTQCRRKAGVLRLLTVSRLFPIKRIPRFIECLVSFAAREKGLLIAYDIIGYGEDFERICRMARATPNNLQIRPLGGMDGAGVRGHYETNEYDLFVLPSESEGLSVAAMEALTRGIPIMATEVGGMRELVVPGVSGFLMKKDFDEFEVEARLREVLSTDGLSLRRSAHDFLRTHFDEKFHRRVFVDYLLSL